MKILKTIFIAVPILLILGMFLIAQIADAEPVVEQSKLERLSLNTSKLDAKEITLKEKIVKGDNTFIIGGENDELKMLPQLSDKLRVQSGMTDAEWLNRYYGKNQAYIIRDINKLIKEK